MDCIDVRESLLQFQRGTLLPADKDRVASHLAGCEACRRAALVESELDDALLHRLPQHAAPLALRRRLAARLPAPLPQTRDKRGRRPWLRRSLPSVVSAFAAAALMLIGMRALEPARHGSTAAELVNEGVNDHLRVVYSAHPVEIESGGIHQVKPWFTGRVDFAPRVAFSGDDEFPLVGGTVGYFRDRKAATFLFKHQLHTISLFVFRADGLPWPTSRLVPIGRLRANVEHDRGFSVVLWRDGELGYCLVSDVNPNTLKELALKVAGEAP